MKIGKYELIFKDDNIIPLSTNDSVYIIKNDGDANGQQKDIRENPGVEGEV